MTVPNGFGARIQQALLEHASQIGQRYTNVQFGKDVGKAERGRAYSSQAVGDWVAERREPGLRTFKAMARVLNRPASWLMALDVEAVAALPKRPRKPAALNSAKAKRATGSG